mgnify:CR=1 FL=1
MQVVVNHQLYVGDCLGVGGFAHRVFGVVGDADIQPGVALQRVDEGAHRAVAVAADVYRAAVVVQGRFQMVVLSTQTQVVFLISNQLIKITIKTETLTVITAKKIVTPEITTHQLTTILQLSQLVVISLIVPAFLELLLFLKRTFKGISTNA